MSTGGSWERGVRTMEAIWQEGRELAAASEDTRYRHGGLLGACLQFADEREICSIPSMDFGIEASEAVTVRTLGTRGSCMPTIGFDRGSSVPSVGPISVAQIIRTGHAAEVAIEIQASCARCADIASAKFLR